MNPQATLHTETRQADQGAQEPPTIRADYVLIFALGIALGLWLAFRMTSVGVEKSTITRKDYNYFTTRKI